MVQEFIVDASVLIQGFIRDADTARVRTLLKDAFDPDSSILHIPEFGLLECTNILWKQVRFHGITLADVQKSLGNLLATPLTVHTGTDLLSRALVVGIEHQLAIYDSIYIAMGETLKHPLITVDVRQSEAAKRSESA